jgi:hypothetical protein
MALVDPFIPRPRPPRVHRPAVLAGDSLAGQTSVQVVPGNTLSKPAPRLSTKNFKVPQRRAGRTKAILQGIVTAVLVIVLGLAAGVLPIGESAIAVYAIVALSLRFNSRTSFTLALLAFAMIILLEILRPTSTLATNFAVYAFLLLIVGTLSQTLEVRQAATWKKWRRQPKRKYRA